MRHGDHDEVEGFSRDHVLEAVIAADAVIGRQIEFPSERDQVAMTLVERVTSCC